MSKPWLPYVVQQGDHLAKLAFLFGTDSATLWNDPRNAELAARRTNSRTLHPGDVIYVPGEPAPALELVVGEPNTYRARVPKVAIRVRLDSSYVALAGKEYELHGLGSASPPRGVVSADSEVAFEVPVWTREVALHFHDPKLILKLRIGDLDPIEEPSGITQRLRNLGHLPATGAISSARLAAAIRTFQAQANLEMTGHLDSATRDAIQREHLG
jgi:hypothetical protein